MKMHSKCQLFPKFHLRKISFRKIRMQVFTSNHKEIWILIDQFIMKLKPKNSKLRSLSIVWRCLASRVSHIYNLQRISKRRINCNQESYLTEIKVRTLSPNKKSNNFKFKQILVLTLKLHLKFLSQNRLLRLVGKHLILSNKFIRMLLHQKFKKRVLPNFFKLIWKCSITIWAVIIAGALIFKMIWILKTINM